MYRQEPNKRPEVVIQTFREYSLINRNAILILVGRYPKDWASYNFGFFNNERFEHIESARGEKLAAIMRACDVMWYPSWGDACPNVVAEALACGLKVEHIDSYGGTIELVEQGLPHSAKEMAEQYINMFEIVVRKDVKIS